MHGLLLNTMNVRESVNQQYTMRSLTWLDSNPISDSFKFPACKSEITNSFPKEEGSETEAVK